MRLNLAHAMQQWLPFAQMPHHHDWHHEGHKGCNYTFSSIGGFWDVCFGTRKNGRHEANGGVSATRRDSECTQPSLLARTLSATNRPSLNYYRATDIVLRWHGV